jgi:hypothetical protein
VHGQVRLASLRRDQLHQPQSDLPSTTAALGITRIHKAAYRVPSRPSSTSLHTHRRHCYGSSSMSFQRSSALESQPTTWRREDDPEYADDPEFREFAAKLGDDLFGLTGGIARLSQELAKIGTNRETPRVRERVKTSVEETSDKFKDIGERLKQLTTWPDVGVCGHLI